MRIFVPLIEGADYTHFSSVGRPHAEAGSTLAACLYQMSAQLVVRVVVASFVEEIQILRAEQADIRTRAGPWVVNSLCHRCSHDSRRMEEGLLMEAEATSWNRMTSNSVGTAENHGLGVVAASNCFPRFVVAVCPSHSSRRSCFLLQCERSAFKREASPASLSIVSSRTVVFRATTPLAVIAAARVLRIWTLACA